jgi:hypothetical protein
MEEQSIGQIFLKIDLLKNQPTIIISKQKNDGRGIMERTFNGRFQVNMGRKGQPSKWITIKCLRILKGLNPNRGGGSNNWN